MDHSSPRSVQTFMCDILLLRQELDVLRGTGLAGSVYKIVPFSINILPKKVISDSNQRETALQPRPDKLAGGDCLVKLNDLVIKVSGLWMRTGKPTGH